MDERDAKLLADNIYKALRPGFLALINSVMRVGIQLDPTAAKTIPDLEFERQADALLLSAERYDKA